MVVYPTQFARIVILLLALIVKMSNAQNFEWAKSIGGSDTDRPRTLKLDKSGNIYIIGEFRDSVDFDPGQGVYNMTTSSTPYGEGFMLKLSPTGAFRWAKKIPVGFGDMSVDKSGNVYSTGSFVGSVDLDPGPGSSIVTSSGGGSYFFVNKLDSSGNFVWGKSIGAWAASCMGGCIVVDTLSNIYLAGGYGPVSSVPINMDFDPGPGTYILSSNGQADVFMLKLDAAGTFVWAKSFGGIFNETPHSMHSSPNGELYLTGTFEGTCDLNPDPGSYFVTSTGQSSPFVSRFDSLGNFLWGKSFEGGIPSSINSDSTENTYVSGYFVGSPDFDPGPNTYTIASSGGYDVFILKLSPSGNFKWARTVGGSGHDQSACSRIDKYGSLITAGSFSGTVDFDPGFTISNQSSTGWYDTFLLKLDSSGNYVYAKTLSGQDSASATFPESFAVNSMNEIYIAGDLSKTADFDPGYFQYNSTSNGAYDVFILKLGPCKLSFGRDSIIQACEGENIILSAPGAAVYNWNPGSINSSSISFIATSPISYTVVGALSPDCSDTLSFNLQVSACLGYTMNETTSENSILIFPNPSNGRFLIQAHSPTPIKITNELGRPILTSELRQEDKYTLEVNLSKPGVYFLVSNYRSQKLVVIH